MITPGDITKAYGNIDLYLFDQILKGRFENRKTLLDAGCGEGRNLKYFTSTGYQVYGIDHYAEAIQMAELVYKDNAIFIRGNIEEYPFPANAFDITLCINVLHHSRDSEQCYEILTALMEMAKAGGILFIRTLLARGPEDIRNGEFYQIGEEKLLKWAEKLNLKWIEPLKKEVTADGRQLCVAVLEKPIIAQ